MNPEELVAKWKEHDPELQDIDGWMQFLNSSLSTGQFRVKIDNAVGFRDIIKGIGEALGSDNYGGIDIPIKLTEDGLSITRMDNSHILLIDLQIPKYNFSIYHAEGVKEFSVTLGDFSKALANLTKKEAVLIEFNDAQDKIVFTIMNGMEREIITPMGHEIQETIPDVKTDPTVSAKMDIAMLLKLSKDFKGDAVKLTATDYNLTFMSKSDEGFISTVVLKGGGAGLHNISVEDGEVSTSYSIAYLTKILAMMGKASPLITLEYAKEMPLKISGELDGAKLTTWLAPRIDIPEEPKEEPKPTCYQCGQESEKLSEDGYCPACLGTFEPEESEEGEGPEEDQEETA